MIKVAQKLKKLRCFSFQNIRKLHNQPDFTTNRYELVRGSYSVLRENDLQFFNELLGSGRVVTDLTDLEHYNVDWFKRFRGNSSVVLKPNSTQEVSKILSFCNENRLAVCPMGGNTGLSCSVPIFDEIVISTELLNRVISFDDFSGSLVCESGCVLENLNNYLEPYNMLVPLDLGSRGSCHIGGNLAMNAGGLRLLRYGSLQGNVLGLEMVKPNGEVLDCLSTLKKDNTGYHLKNIFIGSEGTLGIITKVAVQCVTKFKSVGLAFLGFNSYENALETYKHAKHSLGEILSAVEVIDDLSMQLGKQYLNLQSPIGEFPFYLMIETLGSQEEHDLQKLNGFLEHCFDRKYIVNGTVTTEPSKYRAMWNIRERLPEVYRLCGYSFLYDFTLPLKQFYTLIDEIRKHLGDQCDTVSGFGHLGDGNIHIQITAPQYSKELQAMIEPYIFQQVKKLNGSISAEHGIGFSKAKYLPMVKDTNSLNLMRSIKKLMDPNGIMNPYKVLV